jgi:hypothetical protein
MRTSNSIEIFDTFLSNYTSSHSIRHDLNVHCCGNLRSCILLATSHELNCLILDNIIMPLRILSIKSGNVTSWATVSFSRRTRLHVVICLFCCMFSCNKRNYFMLMTKPAKSSSFLCSSNKYLERVLKTNQVGAFIYRWKLMLPVMSDFRKQDFRMNWT